MFNLLQTIYIYVTPAFLILLRLLVSILTPFGTFNALQHRLPGEMPSYMIVGGLLFTTVTMGLISMAVDEFDEDSWHATLQGKKNPEQQLVVLLAVLAHPINHGYETRRIHQLASCNGEKVRCDTRLFGAKKGRLGHSHCIQSDNSGGPCVEEKC